MKQDLKKGEKNKVGAYGEDIACKYVLRQKHTVLHRNYLKKWGEIDIVTRETLENGHKIHFIEVKTVSYETKKDLEKAVSYGSWRPEENVHRHKIERLNRAIQSWLSENKFDGEWQIDVAAVRIVPNEKFASIKWILNVIL